MKEGREGRRKEMGESEGRSVEVGRREGKGGRE